MLKMKFRVTPGFQEIGQPGQQSANLSIRVPKKGLLETADFGSSYGLDYHASVISV